jgi:hypothetical protein
MINNHKEIIVASFEDLEKNGDAHLAKKEIEPAIAYYTAALSIKPDIQTALYIL